MSSGSPAASSSSPGGGGGGRLPPLGASALRHAVLASAASQTSYDRRTQDLLDKVTDVLSFGPSGLRSGGKSAVGGGSGSSGHQSGGGGGGSNVPTQTTISVVDGRRKQVTALKMDPPSAFDDLREPPRAVKQQILTQLARRNKKRRQHDGNSHTANSFSSFQQQNDSNFDDDDDGDDDEDDYEKKRDRERRQIQEDEDAENNDEDGSGSGAGAGNTTSESAVMLNSKKAAAAAAAKPVPYYLRKGNRHSTTGTNATNQTETMMKSREIVIALGNDRMDSKEMQKVIEHEYAVRMCEQLGISPSATNIARIHKKLPLSECSVTQVMHPGLARGERRNCISIVPKFVKEQEERKLAALRGERNSLWNRANLKKKEDLDETELMTLLRAEEISRQKRQATATIQAHLQQMPIGTSTTAGFGGEGKDAGGGGTDGNTKDGGDHQNNTNKSGGGGDKTGFGFSSLGAGGGKTNAFEDIKNRFVFPFNEPVNNNRVMEGAFERARRQLSPTSSTSPHSSRKNSPSSSHRKKRSTATIPLGRRKNTNPFTPSGTTTSMNMNTEIDNNNDNDNDNNEQEQLDLSSSTFEETHQYGQDRTEARLAMQDKLIQRKIIEKEKDRRRKEQEAEEIRRANAMGGAGTFSNSTSLKNNTNNNISNNNNKQDLHQDDADLRRLLSETDVVRLSKAQLERLAEQRARERNEARFDEDDSGDQEELRHQKQENSHPTSSVAAVQADDDDNGREEYDGRGTKNKKSSSKKGVKINSSNEQTPLAGSGDPPDAIETIDVSAMYKQHLVPPHVITECAGIPPMPAKIDLDEIRRQFLRNVPINDIFGADIGPLLKSAILSEALLKAQEATVEFFTDVCFLGPVKRSELLHENGRWLHKHISSTSIDLQFSKMYETCTTLLRDRGGTASVSRVVTRAAVLFLMLRVTIRSYFVRRSPGLISFDAGNQLLSDMDCIFCASVDPGCLYARIPQLESMPQALRVLHAKRANRTGRRHALNPKAVSAKLQFVLGEDSKVLRRFQSMGSRSFEPVVLRDHHDDDNNNDHYHHNNNIGVTSSRSAKHTTDIFGGTTTTNVIHDDDDVDSDAEEQADLLSHFLDKKEKQQRSGSNVHNNNNMMSTIGGGGGAPDFGDHDYDDDDKNFLGGMHSNNNSRGKHNNKPPVEQTQKHITRGLTYLKRILSPNVKTLLLDLKV